MTAWTKGSTENLIDIHHSWKGLNAGLVYLSFYMKNGCCFKINEIITMKDIKKLKGK